MPDMTETPITSTGARIITAVLEQLPTILTSDSGWVVELVQVQEWYDYGRGATTVTAKHTASDQWFTVSLHRKYAHGSFQSARTSKAMFEIHTTASYRIRDSLRPTRYDVKDDRPVADVVAKVLDRAKQAPPLVEAFLRARDVEARMAQRHKDRTTAFLQHIEPKLGGGFLIRGTYDDVTLRLSGEQFDTLVELLKKVSNA